MPRLLAPPSGVTVRMYRHGLGDCLLLGFASEDAGRPYYVLIDCGVMAATSNETEVMRGVARDLAEATGGHIHLAVATHEHWDHIGGFSQAKEVFQQQLHLDNLWLAWTEDPQDDQAKRLRSEFEHKVQHLKLALQRTDGNSTLAEQVKAILEFHGGLADTGLGFSVKSRGALDDLLALIPKEERRRYLSPGEGPLSLPESDDLSVPGVSVFVLGPPRNEKLLHRLEGRETYEDKTMPSPFTAFTMALRETPPEPTEDDYDLYQLSFPFPERLRLPFEEARGRTFFRRHYQRTDDAWRRIDQDWLGVAGEVALQLDDYTNNTSLVLAFRLNASDKVLLFTGDAQVGSWLSWNDLSWPKSEGEASLPNASASRLTAKDLLARTVYYKVGHHGSHNATIRGPKDQPMGLELMTSRDLVAMVPTNEATAKTKRWFRMPFTPLLTRLDQKTRGRTVRADKPGPAMKPDALSDAEWQAFEGSFTPNSLSMDFSITDAPPQP